MKLCQKLVRGSLLGLGSWLLAFCSHHKCLERRAALDIGSAATTLKVADVDVCTHKIIKWIADSTVRVNYRDDLRKHAGLGFSPEIQTLGLSEIEKMAQTAKGLGSKTISGVATAAFREAQIQNLASTNLFVAKIQERSAGLVKIIPQRDEASLGFQSALTKVNYPAADLLVWDIGGGSMQLTYLNEKNEINFAGFEKGSTSLKAYVLHELEKKQWVSRPIL